MKTNHLFYTMLVAATLCGCAQHEDEVVPQGSKPVGSIVATIDQTRTSLDATLKVVWTNGDQIRLFGASAPTGAVYATVNDAVNTAAFSPVSDAVSDATRYAVYPASAAASSTLSGSALSVDFAALASQTYTGALDATANIAALPMVASSTSDAFTFHNLCGGVRLQLNDYQMNGIQISKVEVSGNAGEALAGVADVDASASTVTLRTVVASKAVVTCATPVALSSDNNPAAHTDFVVFLPAATYAQGLTFTLTDSTGRVYTQATAANFAISAGVIKPMALLPVTLFYGTTNCILTDPTAKTLDVDITPRYSLSPHYAYQSHARVNATSETVDKATAASVVWTQTNTNATGDVLSAAPTIEGTTLHVPVSGVRGNAVVAIKDAAGTILWSFHIWVSEANDLAYTNSAEGALRTSFTMMDRNLGATSITPKDRNAYGAFYQWGRKDPFPRPMTYTRATSVTTIELTPHEQTSATVGTIAYTLSHPDTRVLSSDDWHFTNRNNALWGNTDNLTAVKTVYDPCPAGYCVADQACYKGLVFTTAAACDSNYGHLFVIDGTNTSYYPTGGCLDKAADKLSYAEYRGYIWTSNYGTTGAFDFYFNNAGVNAAHGIDRATACELRCRKIQ